MGDFDLNAYHFIAQTVGFVAFLLGIYAYAQTCDKKIKTLMAVQNIVLAVHFVMLGRFSASTANIITALRNYLAIFGKFQKWALVFIVFYILFGLTSMQKWFDLLPVIASVISTWNYFHYEGIKFRILLAVVNLIWLTHNILAFSIGPALMELIMLMTVCRVIYKMRKPEKAT